MHIFLGLHYRDALIITLYFVVLEISNPKIRRLGNYITLKNQHVLNERTDALVMIIQLLRFLY